MAAVHDFISEALKAGYSMDSIVADLSKSEDDEEKTFAKNWLSTASKPEYAPGGTTSPGFVETITPMLNVINENPKTALGVVGGIAASKMIGAGVKAYNAYQDRKMSREAHESEIAKNNAYVKQVDLSAQKQLEGQTTQDIIDQTKQMQKQVKQPVASVENLPQATPVGGMTQPSALPQGYGQQTINQPTGVPNVAAPNAPAAPPADVIPQPVDPIQAARIRKAEAEAAIAEHKLQQLQAGPKTVASGKSATPGYSETEMKMVQQGGAASASKALEAKQIAGSVAPTPDPVMATATPAEKAAAVTVVEEAPKATSTGMREQYHKSKKNPIGPGGFNWLSGQEGPKAQQLWEEVYGKKNVPYEQVVSDYSKAKVGPQIPRESGKPGGSFEKPKEIPEYIKGSASIPALLSLAGNALGVAAITKEVKEAKKTGDWSNVGLDVIGQILGNIAPKAGLGFSLMAPGALNADESQRLQEYRKKAPTIDGAAVPR